MEESHWVFGRVRKQRGLGKRPPSRAAPVTPSSHTPPICSCQQAHAGLDWLCHGPPSATIPPLNFPASAGALGTPDIQTAGDKSPCEQCLPAALACSGIWGSEPIWACRHGYPAASCRRAPGFEGGAATCVLDATSTPWALLRCRLCPQRTLSSQHAGRCRRWSCPERFPGGTAVTGGLGSHKRKGHSWTCHGHMAHVKHLALAPAAASHARCPSPGRRSRHPAGPRRPACGSSASGFVGGWRSSP